MTSSQHKNHTFDWARLYLEKHTDFPIQQAIDVNYPVAQKRDIIRMARVASGEGGYKSRIFDWACLYLEKHMDVSVEQLMVENQTMAQKRNIIRMARELEV